MAQAYQLKITLADSEPEVWRRLQVPAQIALQELHDIVQKAMGWENQHDYAFRQALGAAACDPQQSLADTLCAIEEGRPFYYTYDFQSGWLHRIDVEGLVVVEEAAIATKNLPTKNLPICLEGNAACPPESSGGVWGYEELMDRLEDTSAPDYIDVIDQYGNFDPHRFDLAAANSRLSKQAKQE
jgi:Plasmid pRiA4b ORF-3-like protein